ncbi:MAG: hypothetical protein QXH97_00315 [Candidatus Bathyarchaeia archaeon]
MSSVNVREGDIIAPQEHKWEGSLGFKYGLGYAYTNKHVIPQIGMQVIAPPEPWKDGPIIGVATKTVKWKNPTTLDYILYILFGRPLPANKVDATLITLRAGVSVNKSFNTPDEIVAPIKGMKVLKRGRTTGETEGVVLDENVTIRVYIDQNRSLLFTDVFRFSNKTLPGDSGGPLRTDRGILGLTFAGPESGEYGFGIKAKSILEEIPP